MLQSIRTRVKALCKAAKARYAPFVAFDSHGTFKREWTLNAACAWLPYCAESAAVFNAYSRKPLAFRVQVSA